MSYKDLWRKQIVHTTNMSTTTTQPDTTNFIHHEITLKHRQDDQGNRVWCWIRSDGVQVSPVFKTREAAHFFQGKIPFLTDQEWMGRFAVPYKSPKEPEYAQ